MGVDKLSHIHFTGKWTALPDSRRKARVRPGSSRPSSEKRPPTVIPPEVPLRPFMTWLFLRAGLEAGAYQTRILERRFQACLRHLEVRSEEGAREVLERQPDLVPSALDQALIGVSSFFRDPSVFRSLGEELESGWLRERRGMRVLSAGASGGQELYSLAMMLQEAGALAEADLVGVDCRPSAVVRAGEGVFEERELEGLEAGRRARYFVNGSGRYRIDAFLKSRATWHAADALAFRDVRPFNLILCRNVAIYLTATKSRELWRNLEAQLLPGGLLVTGKAEQPPSDLRLVSLSPCLFRKEK